MDTERLLKLLQDVPYDSMAPQRVACWLGSITVVTSDSDRMKLWEELVEKMTIWSTESFNRNVPEMTKWFLSDDAKVTMINTCCNGTVTEEEARFKMDSLLATLGNISSEHASLRVIKIAVDTGRMCTIEEADWTQLANYFLVPANKEECWAYLAKSRMIDEEFMQRRDQKSTSFPFHVKQADVKITVIRNGKTIDGTVTWPRGTAQVRIGLPVLSDLWTTIGSIVYSVQCSTGCGMHRHNQDFAFTFGQEEFKVYVRD